MCVCALLQLIRQRGCDLSYQEDESGADAGQEGLEAAEPEQAGGKERSAGGEMMTGRSAERREGVPCTPGKHTPGGSNGGSLWN